MSPCVSLLINPSCRLAYYGLASSIVLFWQRDLNMGNEEANNQYSAWSGICYVTPLLGGYLADSFLGRFRSILIFSAVYLVGLIFLAFATLPADAGGLADPKGLIFAGLYIVALGTGARVAPCSIYMALV